MTRTFGTYSKPHSLMAVFLAIFSAALMALMLSSTMAQAILTHPFTGQSFGPTGLGGEPFPRPEAIAVDQNSGDVFVYDAGLGEARIYKFNASGESVNFAASGTNVIIVGHDGNESESEIAIDSSAGPRAGDIYLANAREVRIYDASGGFLGTLTGGETCGVAVDPSGAVYVGAYPRTVRKYTSLANPVTNADETTSMGGLESICNVAVDGGGNVYAATYTGGITRYDALQFGSLAATGTPIDKFGRTLAVDPSSGDVYVNDQTSIVQYAPTGAVLTSFGAGELSNSFGIAVNGGAGGEVYAPAVSKRINIYGPAVVVPDAITQEASNVTETSATIAGSVNPQGAATTYQFEYGITAEYGSVLPASPQTVGSDSAAHSVSVELNGLSLATTYHYRVVATNVNGTTKGEDATFRTAAHPVIDEESFSGAGSSGLTLNAQVNDFGFLSMYYYEYGTSNSYGAVTPELTLGATEGDTGAPAPLEGLQPNTTYHYRIVVTNEAGTVQGADAQFTTLPSGVVALPDGRLYEMVTPPDKRNVNVFAPGEEDTSDHSVGRSTIPFQASLEGDRITYVAQAQETTGGGSGLVRNEYVAIRGAQGWTEMNLQPTGDKTAAYQAISNDVTTGFVEACRQPLAENAPGENYTVLYSHAFAGTTFEPLFTVTPPNRAPEEFVTAGRLKGASCKTIVYAGTSSDESHVLFEANDALTPEARPTPPSVVQNDLYDAVRGQLTAVNVLPGPSGTVEPNATFGAFSSEPFPKVDFSHVISTDGSRIFWTDRNTGDLYVRENSGTPEASTVQVDASVGGGGVFWTANASGSRVFFTKAGNLYAFDVETNQTSDIAPEGEVLGVTGASEDGNYIYYVAQATLASGASAGQPNLYLSRDDGSGWSAPVFVATLSPADEGGNVGDWQSDLTGRTAETTPDGHNVVFLSYGRLTGYDNRNVQEVYTYDADTGELTCVSCSRSGEAPTFEGGGQTLMSPAGNRNHMTRWISADGNRIFFNDLTPLVPNDSNGQRDVYEWEREGSGGCKLDDGCLSLLSGGTSTGGSYLLDTSLNGDDVFIVTRAQLEAADTNDNTDIYDVRVGATKQPSPPACTGSGCQGIPPGQPIFATPSSVTFNGVGNFQALPKATVGPRSKKLTRAQRLAEALKACAKKQRGKRRTCQRQARKRYGTKSKATKSTKGRKQHV